MRNLIKRILKEEIIKSFLMELDSLNIPKEDYIIFGSGPMAIKGLLEPSDLDVVVTENVYREMFGDEEPIRIGNIELSYTWPDIDIEELFNNVVWYEGYPFAHMKMVKLYKKQMNRKKDIEDLNLLNPD